MLYGLRSLLALAIAVSAAISVSQIASAQLVNPFVRDLGSHPLNSEDRELMKEAIHDALEQYIEGAVSIWESKSSGRAGRAVVTKTYEKNGMRCAELTHEFTKGPGTTYTAPLCKTGDGTWKFAF